MYVMSFDIRHQNKGFSLRDVRRADGEVIVKVGFLGSLRFINESENLSARVAHGHRGKVGMEGGEREKVIPVRDCCLMAGLKCRRCVVANRERPQVLKLGWL
jgi:hypothetical protein